MSLFSHPFPSPVFMRFPSVSPWKWFSVAIFACFFLGVEIGNFGFYFFIVCIVWVPPSPLMLLLLLLRLFLWSCIRCASSFIHFRCTTYKSSQVKYIFTYISVPVAIFAAPLIFNWIDNVSHTHTNVHRYTNLFYGPVATGKCNFNAHTFHAHKFYDHFQLFWHFHVYDCCAFFNTYRVEKGVITTTLIES